MRYEGESRSRRTVSRLNDAVYDQLRGRLMEGDYPAGQRLSAEALRVEFGVSKQPVMEALRRLAADGLIEIQPQVGSRVMAYTLREVADFYMMFGGFEGTIAGIAALRRTEEQVAELDAISTEIDALREEADPRVRSRGYRVLNRNFHDAIHDMAHSQIAADTSRRLWDLSDFLINTTGVPQPLSSALDERHADHERIRAAIHAGDAEGARREMEAHIVGTIDVINAEAHAVNGTAPR
ncbi:GntR family transcriptional regulator [Mycolicibacterium sp. 120266]|uniref:GntR family transcriptional regulator n=1 Tax=Mycolicibacterium sp. 120266 TaxID=3090601 RepID=UPI00299D1ECA|nr:GntR family transcriptional regulator [Mycolicibacterium sp. 120266]MDX1874120.1 GntR family transcriptional regulator [Mycolicibacterium sp. 120266]